jgi:hypothetical protein
VEAGILQRHRRVSGKTFHQVGVLALEGPIVRNANCQCTRYTIAKA